MDSKAVEQQMAQNAGDTHNDSTLQQQQDPMTQSQMQAEEQYLKQQAASLADTKKRRKE